MGINVDVVGIDSNQQLGCALARHEPGLEANRQQRDGRSGGGEWAEELANVGFVLQSRELALDLRGKRRAVAACSSRAARRGHR